MDGDHNPLSALPRAQRFQIMVFQFNVDLRVCDGRRLGVLWRTLNLAFLLASGVLITGLTFRSARQLTPTEISADKMVRRGTTMFGVQTDLAKVGANRLTQCPEARTLATQLNTRH